jgi:hypothetical protein
VSQNEGEKVYQVLIELPHLITVLEAIRDVIPYFNERLAADASTYTLSTDASLYDLYKAKKTGHAKTDYPALDSGQILNQTSISAISLVERAPNAIISKNKPVPDPKPNQKSTPQVLRVEEIKSSGMVSSTVPASKVSTQGTRDEEYIEITTYCCGCIPKKQKVLRTQYNISMTGNTNLNENLISKQ